MFKITYDRKKEEHQATPDELMTYHDIVNHIYREQSSDDADKLWRFKSILAHSGPFSTDSPDYKGSTWNLLIEWETGEQTEEPLNLIIADDPLTVAQYAKDNNLLDTPGWKRLKRIASREKKLSRLINQAKLRSFRTAPKYQYGFQVPRTYREAVELDRRNGNTKWTDAIKLEIIQLKIFIKMLRKRLQI